MWQTVVILVLLAAVLVYVIRHYVRVFRSEVPSCSGCSGCCGVQSSARDVAERCDCGERKTGLR
ncbi:FeoB-associated Cys-rich membrane protein [Desulforhabdus amnigena]|uniref:FeoB-associated Cys-rich membrane protein n=1 Tax=Desulforhabdus amnigena TaxID=40218 RepID=A0A9W6FUN0_9BACT|nr:FeoB-associated Cys-rich membrane protein [Desulforhabdus amnigena]NLJ29532.1 hypothetical protein [Deltaproteobacteria bacterium]GLI35162.1 hypothetical protein DAMNIGENAA_25950 [Desulforhabdus amnigena]